MYEHEFHWKHLFSRIFAFILLLTLIIIPLAWLGPLWIFGKPLYKHFAHGPDVIIKRWTPLAKSLVIAGIVVSVASVIFLKKNNAWLYILRGPTGKLVYIGITNNLVRRLNEHSASKDWWNEVDLNTSRYKTFRTRDRALKTEKKAIKALKPPANKQYAA